VVTRFGSISLVRQVLEHRTPTTDHPQHILPGNAALPAHNGIILTRGVQEWSCLLAQDLPFESVKRLLGWQTQEPGILSATTIRSLVQQHGASIRAAELQEAQALLERADLSTLTPVLRSHTEPRHRAAWSPELNEAIDGSLAAADPRPPDGVTRADWERVLAVRQREHTDAQSVETLRRLGPRIAEDEVIAATDEVLTRKPTKRKFWEHRTARVATSDGYRYVSGQGDLFGMLLLVLIVLCAGKQRSLRMLGDGARWIRGMYDQVSQQVRSAQLILDWWHLRKKCSDFASMICAGRKEKARLLKDLYGKLWNGAVDDAIAVLEAYRPSARNGAKLDELVTYLHKHQDSIPNYRALHRNQEYIGSGHAEKANDLLVARRQKKKGMHWSYETSDALASLQTLRLNGGWEHYWGQGKVLPLAVA
jgi:hypothetical protein